MSQRHSKEMSLRDHVKCKWTFQPHHGSKVFVFSYSHYGFNANCLQVLVRYLTADFPETEHCAGSYLRLGENNVLNFIPSPGSTMRPPLHILRGSIIQATTPPAASTSSPRKSQGLTTIFLLNLTVTYFQSIQQWPSYHGV